MTAPPRKPIPERRPCRVRLIDPGSDQRKVLGQQHERGAPDRNEHHARDANCFMVRAAFEANQATNESSSQQAQENVGNSLK